MWVCRVSTQRSRSRSSAAQPALPRLGPCKPAGSEQGRDPSPLYSHVLCRGLPRGSEKARNPHRGRGGTGNPLLTPPHPLPQGRPPWVLGKDVCPRALPGPRGAAAPPFPAPGPTLPQLPALSLPGGRGGGCSLEQGTALGVSTWRWNSSHQRTGGSSLNSSWRMPAPPRVSPRAARLVQRMPPLGSVGR